MPDHIVFPISLADKSEIELKVFPESKIQQTLFRIPREEAIEENEAELQIVEGFTYEYLLTEGYCFADSNKLLIPSKINSNLGRIVPNTFVGRTKLTVLKVGEEKPVGEFYLEIRSIKTSYRNDYRTMLKDISDYCIDLIFQSESPVIQSFTVDHEVDSRSLYQKFSFLKSILDSDEFHEAVARITSSPVTGWMFNEATRDIRNAKRLGTKSLRQLVGASRRVHLPQSHPLRGHLPSIPERVDYTEKTDTIDTPENRFIKYALQSFLLLVDTIKQKTKDYDLKTEASQLLNKIENHLSHSLFKGVSNIQTIPYNNPVLQRRDGYREVFRTWLMMSLAAKLTWSAAEEDVYGAGKRDVANLYEYWVFFKLLSIVTDLFQLKAPDISSLIELTENEISIRLKQGKYIPLQGVFNSPIRKLKVQFSYNKSFSKNSKYPEGGSWSETFRPDYTLSVWPFGIKEEEAEQQELIVHIHFDAKYRIENLSSIFSTDEATEEEVIGNKTSPKRIDIIKMHAYRDAIRRTAGAYIIYPGDRPIQKKGFHELIPGLGAFTLNPTPNDNGVDTVKRFIVDVLHHFQNRATQRERYSYQTFAIHREPPVDYIHAPMPEAIGANRGLLPDDTIVLVGYYKDEEHLKWIMDKHLYNVRVGSERGAIGLDLNLISASYLILHTKGSIRSNRMLKIRPNQLQIMTGAELKILNYPRPWSKNYILFSLEKTIEKEFENLSWDLTKLEGFNNRELREAPLYVTLTHLMKVVVKE